MADERATVDYDVKIEDVGPALKRVTITVPASVVDEKIQESLGTLASDAAGPGFRRGHVPRRLLERRFGSKLREETRDRLMSDAYAKVFAAHGVQAVGQAEPTEPPGSITLEEG